MIGMPTPTPTPITREVSIDVQNEEKDQGNRKHHIGRGMSLTCMLCRSLHVHEINIYIYIEYSYRCSTSYIQLVTFSLNKLLKRNFFIFLIRNAVTCSYRRLVVNLRRLFGRLHQNSFL